MQSKGIQMKIIQTILLFLITFSFINCEENTKPENFPYETGTVKDIDGNVYTTVNIGDQWWMAENLRVTHYQNQDAIEKISNSEDWFRLNNSGKDAYCYYDNNENYLDEFGCLYNWIAVADNRNIAPQGWRIPSNEDWEKLIQYPKKNNEDTFKSENGWIDFRYGGGTDDFGFNALPAGWVTREFVNMGSLTIFWSETEYDENSAWHLRLDNSYSTNELQYSDKYYGFSVRCVKDAN